jgi:hypothetical protein
MGIGDKLFAIPLEAFKFGQHGHDYTLNVDKAILEKAEGFGKNKSSLIPEELYRMLFIIDIKPYCKA